jgi:hypothetical protein
MNNKIYYLYLMNQAMFSGFIQSLWFQVLHIVIVYVFNLYYYSYNYYFNTFSKFII